MHLGCKTFIGGVVRSLFGNGAYTSNIIQGSSTLQPDANGLVTVSGAATVAPDAGTLASVVMLNKLLVTGASAALIASTSSKALILIAKTSITLASGGKIHMNGIRYPGDFGGVALPSLIPAAVSGKIKTSDLAAIIFGATKTAANTAATAMCAGGGGDGETWNSYYRGVTGSPAGSLCGGSGGSGNPADGSMGGGGVGGIGGGVIILLSPSIVINTGCTISANGANGESADAPGGGGGGGGIVWIGYKGTGYTNNGTVSANGGVGGTGYSQVGQTSGYSGGAGSVNLKSF